MTIYWLGDGTAEASKNERYPGDLAENLATASNA